MPGPVSDSYDPEFGTGSNAGEIREAIQEIRDNIGNMLGSKLMHILDVVRMDESEGKTFDMTVSERELRIVRFMTERSLETI